MVNTRYKKLTGIHADHLYKVMEPASEIDTPMRWVLHGETVKGELLIVSEHDLADALLW